MGERKRRQGIGATVPTDTEARLLMRDCPWPYPSTLVDSAEGRATIAGALRFAAINRRDGRVALEKIAPLTAADRVLALLGITRGLIHPRTDQANTQWAEEKTVACAAGCSSCCHRVIDGAIPEAIVMAMELVADDDPRRVGVAQAAAELAGRLDAVPGRATLRCPFLAPDGRCSTHAARPIACRGFLADDHQKCAASLADGKPLIAYTLPQLLGQANVAALQGICKDAGVQANRVVMVEAVAMILADPGLIDRWAAGEAVFPLERAPVSTTPA